MTKKDAPTDYRNTFKIEGNRIGVLLVHSMGGSPIELRFVAQGLARLGCTVHCPMIPGLADGTDIADLSSWQDWYAVVERAHDELLAKCDVVIVGGLSVGTLLALRLAAKRPDQVHGLMLYAPTMWPNGWAIPKTFNFFRLVRQKWLARMFRFTLGTPYGIKDERIRKFVVDTASSEDRPLSDVFGRGGGVMFELGWLAKEIKRLLPEIRQQTLIFHPRHDDQSNLSTAFLLQRKMAGLVEMFVLDDSYHRVTFDRQRTLVMDRTVDFATRLTQRIGAGAEIAQKPRAPSTVAAE